MQKKWKVFRGLTAVFCALTILFVNVTGIAKDNEGSVSRFFGIKVSTAGELTAENTIYKTDFTDRKSVV